VERPQSDAFDPAAGRANPFIDARGGVGRGDDDGIIGVAVGRVACCDDGEDGVLVNHRPVGTEDDEAVGRRRREQVRDRSCHRRETR